MSFVMNSAGHELETKRKRTWEESQEDIDRRPFSIRQDSSDPFAKPRTFTPICLLPRSKLPLAYLDTAHDGSRMFTAHIQCLEAEDEDSLLIVEDQMEGRIYAVEKVQQRRYALCRLGEGVNMEDLTGQRSRYGQQSQKQRMRRAVEVVEGEKPWWMNAGVEADVENVPVLKEDIPKLSMLRKQRQALSDKTQVADLPNSVSTTAAAPGVLDKTTSAPGPAVTQDPLEELAKAYLDALYLSRTPVAYFVKGPLARARAAFTSQPAELVAFLRAAVLTVNVTDKKYRETITEHIKELPLQDSPEDRRKKRRRKWKPRRDKYGLFVDEKDYLEQWWRGDDDDRSALDSTEKIDAVIRRRSQRLRSRETFLQVVLILEIIALEASAVKTALTSAPEPQPIDSQADESQVATEDKKTKKKKEVDMPTLLDSLLDRLVIWQSIALESPTKNMDNLDDKEEVSDDLKSFASEVIIPFFAARIHEQANTASKKLGGPTQPHPSKSKASVPRKPGEPAVRQPPAKKPRKPLEKVPSDALNKVTKRHPSLHRAATDSDALSAMIKREMSETPPMDSIPLSRRGSQQRGVPAQRKRPSMLESLSRREVDLSAMSQATEAKLKKKTELQEKMRDAIDTLKKPNRSRAVEEHAKSTDESFAKAIAKSKSNARRKVMEKNAIAVTATPRHVKATPAPNKYLYQDTGHSRSTGSTSMVPGTSARQLAVPDEIPNSSLAVPQTGHRPRHGPLLVDGTPCRGFAKYMPPALSRNPGTSLESPTSTRKPQILSTPAKVSKMPSLIESPLSKVPGSSLKGRTYSPNKHLAASLSSSTEQKEDSGIAVNEDAALYNALGWDDDEYEELP